MFGVSQRSYVARARFKIMLHEFRERDNRWKLIENFSKVVQQGHEMGLLKTFDPAEDLSPERDEKEEGITLKEK